MTGQEPILENSCYGQLLQKGLVSFSQLTGGPHNSLIGNNIKILGQGGVQDCTVVITGDADDAASADKVNAFPGIGVIPDQIAQMDYQINPFPGNRLQHRFKCFQIGMDV